MDNPTLVTALNAYYNDPNHLLIVKMEDSWSVVIKENPFWYFIKWLFTGSRPYTEEQTNKYQLNEAILGLNESDVHKAIYAINTLYKKWRNVFTNPFEEKENIHLKMEDENRQEAIAKEPISVKNYFSDKSVKWLTGTKSLTLQGLENNSLVPTGQLVRKYSSTPFAGELGRGIAKADSVNQDYLSGGKNTYKDFIMVEGYAKAPLRAESPLHIQNHEMELVDKYEGGPNGLLRTQIAIIRLIKFDLLTDEKRVQYLNKFKALERSEIVDILEHPEKVKRMDSKTFEKMQKKAFPIILGSTKLEDNRLVTQGRGITDTAVLGEAKLGEDIDFALTDEEHENELREELKRVSLEHKVQVFSISAFKKHFF